jgi:hypothetical protein
VRSETAKAINQNGPPQRPLWRPQGALPSINASPAINPRIPVLDSDSRLPEERLPRNDQRSQLPQLVATRRAAEILGRSPATLKRWRYEGIGPDYVEMEGRVRYDLNVLLAFIRKNTRVPSVRAALEETRGVV